MADLGRLESLVPGDPWVTLEYRERPDLGDFLDYLVYLDLMDPQDSKETEGWVVIVDLLGWDMKDLLVLLDLMGPKDLKVLVSLELKVFGVLLANTVGEVCLAVLALWGPLVTVNSVKPFRCKLIEANLRRGPNLSIVQLLIRTLPLKLPKASLLKFYMKTLNVIFLRTYVMTASFVNNFIQLNIIVIFCLVLGLASSIKI